MSIVSSEPPSAARTTNPDRAGVYRSKVSTPPAKPARKPSDTARRPQKKVNRTVSGTTAKKFQAGTRSNSSSRRRTVSPTSPQKPARRRPEPAAADRETATPLKRNPPTREVPSAGRPEVKKGPATASSAAPKRQPVKSKTRTNYSRLADGRLKLQALAWSDDAARRMAVINGRIVHEGESVDGYQVMMIREEDVIVREKGQSWSLEFGLRQ